MKEDQLNTLREQDKNLRDAIRMEEMELPEMPADLNARLMQRVTSEKKQPRHIIWPWVAAACVAGMLMIWLTPPKDEPQEMALAPIEKPVKEATPLIAQQEPKASECTAPQPTMAKAVAVSPQKSSAKPIAEAEEAPIQTQEAVTTDEKVVCQEPAKMLTERDLPITRPENLKYTPEELALMKQQAHEAYLKWVELELEISKHYIEQTAQNE